MEVPVTEMGTWGWGVSLCKLRSNGYLGPFGSLGSFYIWVCQIQGGYRGSYFKIILEILTNFSFVSDRD